MEIPTPPVGPTTNQQLPTTTRQTPQNMSTIIGITNKHGACIAADGRISSIDQDGYTTQINTLPKNQTKVIKNNGWIIGTSGDLRAINLLQHAHKPTKPPTHNNIEKHIITKFIPELRNTFDTHGYSLPQREQSTHVAEHSSTILIAAKGQIFCIDGDYSVLTEQLGIYAIGSGAQYALGHLYTLRHTIPNLKLGHLEQTCIGALETAAHWDPHTGPPYTTHTQTRNPK